MSSMGEHSLDQAIVLFDQVVQKNGPLRWAARNEQAVIERKLGKPKDALALYDEVLKSDAGAVRQTGGALRQRATFFSRLERTDPNNYQRAIEIYDQLASDKNEPIRLAQPGALQKGLVPGKEKRPSRRACDVLQDLGRRSAAGPAARTFWYYKAGFNAARLLEEDSKWESAAAIYDKLAAAGGSRSEEAKARLNNLRLGTFSLDGLSARSLQLSNSLSAKPME